MEWYVPIIILLVIVIAGTGLGVLVWYLFNDTGGGGQKMCDINNPCPQDQYCDTQTKECKLKCINDSQCATDKGLICDIQSGIYVPRTTITVTNDSYSYNDANGEAFTIWVIPVNPFIAVYDCTPTVVAVFRGKNIFNISLQYSSVNPSTYATMLIQWYPTPGSGCSDYTNGLNLNTRLSFPLSSISTATFSQDFQLSTDEDFGILRIFMQDFANSSFSNVTISLKSTQ